MTACRRALALTALAGSLLALGLALPFVAEAVGAQGPTWTVQTSGTSNNLHGITFIDDDEGWAVGENQTVLHTVNGGATWLSQPTPTMAGYGSNYTLLDVCFVNSQDGWAVGFPRAVLHTSNGGVTWSWQLQQDFDSSQNFYAVDFADAANGWICSPVEGYASGPTSMATANGGNLWKSAWESGGYLYGLWVQDLSSVWAVGSAPYPDSSYLGHLTSSGWSRVAGTSGYCLNAIDSGDGRQICAVGQAAGRTGLVVRSGDSGASWADVSVGSSMWKTPLDAIAASDQNFWAAGNRFLHWSGDGGQTWGTNSAFAVEIHGVCFVADSVGWVVGDRGLIAKTANGNTADTLPPTTVPQGTGTAWHNNSVTVDLLASDAGSGVAVTEYSLDGQGWVSGDSLVVGSDGDHTLAYRSTDRAANVEATQTEAVRIDTVKPVTSPTVDSGWYQADTSIMLNPSDAMAGIASTKYSLDGGDWTEGSSYPLRASGSQGQHTLKYYSTDNAGNVEATRSVQFRVDGEAPTTASDYDGKWHYSSVSVTLTATDFGSGVAKTESRLDSGEWATGTTVTIPASIDHSNDGLHMLEYRSVDVLGHTETIHTSMVKIDTRAPVSSNLTPTGWQTASLTPSFSAADETGGSGVAQTQCAIDGGGWTIASSRPIISADGTHSLSFRSIDRAGNIEAPQSAQVLLDQHQPSTTDNGTSSWIRTDVVIALRPFDATSGVAATYYRLDGVPWSSGTGVTVSAPASHAADGLHVVDYYSVDVAGNVESIKTRQVKIDTTTPVTICNATGAWTRSNPVVVLFSADDAAGSGVAQVQSSVDGGDTWTTGASRSVSAEGTTTILYRGVDVAGNVEGERFCTVKIDTTAPSTQVSGADLLWHGSAVPLTFTASDGSGSGMSGGSAKTECKLDSGGWITGTALTVPASVDHSNDGTHAVGYRSVDAVGNVEGERFCTVKIDTSAPVGSFSLADGAATTTSTQISVDSSVSDMSGPPEMCFTVDGGVGWTSWEPYAQARTVTLPSGAGMKTVAVLYRDAAGNALRLVDTIDLVTPMPTPDPTSPSIARLSPSSAARGVTVTISGNDFGDTRGRTYVKFGATRCAKYVSWSATRIKCKVPAKAKFGKVKVTVTTAAGTSTAKKFTVKR